MSASAQRVLLQSKILDGVNKSRAPAGRSHTAPVTPSSIDRANRYNQCSAEKLFKPPIASVAAVVAIPISELTSIQEHDTDKGEGTIAIILPREVTDTEVTDTNIDKAAEETNTHIKPATEETDANGKELGDLVRLPSMFNRDVDIDNPDCVCTAKHLCRSIGNQKSMKSLCINCNRSAHHFCAEYLHKQSPVEEPFWITVKDFTTEGKIRFKKMPTSLKNDVMFFILCQCKWKAIKVSAQAKLLEKASKKNKNSSTGGECTPKKRAKSMTAPVAVVRKLRRVAAFYSQVYIFTKVEKTKADVRFVLIEEQFYGNPQKCVKGACEMLLAGDGPFNAIYYVIKSESTRELVLKASCCGRDTASSYVAGVHFTIKDIITFGVGKKVKGRQLWTMGLNVMRSIKKALAVVPKLLPSIVIIDKNCAVIGYASEKNESSFLQHVDNGIFALSLDERGVDTVKIDEDMEMIVDKDKDNIDNVAADIHDAARDRFGCVIALEGYVFIGKLAFLCFGPTSKLFAGMLAMGGQSY